MKVKVIGKKYSNFLDSNGKMVEIYGVFLTHKNPLDNASTVYEGMGCSDFPLPKDIWETLSVDCYYSMEFDRKGKLVEISPI